MKKCIWCLNDENKTTFIKLAHTIPQSLGGKKICEQVCDNCNKYFGDYQNKIPSIETVIKEAFNISRLRLIDGNQIGRNKALPRFSSIYFNINSSRTKFSLKPAYKFHLNFQETLARQLKKGIYKIYLEETERQFKNGKSDKFNFIREFCRYDFGDYPLFYYERKHGIIMTSKSWIETPELFMNDAKPFKYLVDEPGFFEFELFGHVFAIATSISWKICFDNYIKKSIEAKKNTFKNIVIINKFSEIDLVLNILND